MIWFYQTDDIVVCRYSGRRCIIEISCVKSPESCLLLCVSLMASDVEDSGRFDQSPSAFEIPQTGLRDYMWPHAQHHVHARRQKVLSSVYSSGILRVRGIFTACGSKPFRISALHSCINLSQFFSLSFRALFSIRLCFAAIASSIFLLLFFTSSRVFLRYNTSLCARFFLPCFSSSFRRFYIVCVADRRPCSTCTDYSLARP